MERVEKHGPGSIRRFQGTARKDTQHPKFSTERRHQVQVYVQYFHVSLGSMTILAVYRHYWPWKRSLGPLLALRSLNRKTAKIRSGEGGECVGGTE
jgi:hypothetical protein